MGGTRLCSYKLIEDSGFAPNPFFGVLTLATGMPDIRRSAAIDDWIAGFTSADLCGDPPGAERLVFLMRVEERLTIAGYFGDSRFTRKIPCVDGAPEVIRHGDNIYHPVGIADGSPGQLEQLCNPHHWDHSRGCEDERSKRDDVAGRHVLIAREFVYFGRNALKVPDFVRPVLPTVRSRCATLTDDIELARAFIDFALGKANRPVTAPPHAWPDGDDSWRR